MHFISCGLAVLSFLVTPLLGQDSPVRRSQFAELKLLSTAGSDLLRVAPNDTTNPCSLEWTTYYPQTTRTTVTLPFQRAGGLIAVGGGDYLASGWSLNGDGALVRVRLQASPRDILIVETQTYSFDPYSIAWTGDRLLVLDWEGKTILAALWDGISPLPTAFSTAIDSTQVAALQKPGALALSAAPSGLGVYLTYADRRIRRVYHDGSAWQAVTANLYEGSHPWAYRVEQPAIVRSFGPVNVWGEPGSFALVDLALGSIVATAQITSTSSPISVVPQSEMVPGNPHQIEGTSGGSKSLIFAPLVRYGQPSATTTFKLGQGVLDPNKAQVDSPNFVVGTRISHVSPPPTVDESWPAALWVDARSAGGVDPVDPSGTFLQNPPIVLGFMVSVQAGKTSAPVPYTFPIPNDPALAGTVLLFQFAVQRQTEVGVTDVFGVTIRDGGASLTASQLRRPAGASAWNTRAAPERQRIYDAAIRWLKSLASSKAGQHLYQQFLSTRQKG